jgi:hypothetical protein
MRRIPICTIVVLALLAAVPACYARVRSHKHAQCPAPKHALVADAQAEIYEVEREYFACEYFDGHVYALGSRPEGTPEGGGGVELESVRLAGATVAYEEFEVKPEGTSYWRVIVRDLRSGRMLHRLPSMGGFVWDLVVKSDGSVAWIVGAGGQPREYKVVSADKTGIQTLASGVGIAPSSLALAGSTLYWTQNSMPFSAPLE